MFHKHPISLALALLLTVTLPPSRAAELAAIQLPPPESQGGKPLMEVLRQRETTRAFKPDPLSPQITANLLWSAFGINRPATGQRTAPSAMNSQEVDIYVALADGVYLYDAKASLLKPVCSGDLRAQAGSADFAKAPVTLIYVADLSRLAKADPPSRQRYATFDAGCICQNVYLFCASAGLGTVVHERGRSPLSERLKLKPDQLIILAQAVGYRSGL